MLIPPESILASNFEKLEIYQPPLSILNMNLERINGAAVHIHKYISNSCKCN